MTVPAEDRSAQESVPESSSQGNEMVNLVAPLWSEKRAREALGDLTADEVAKRRSDGSLLGLQAAEGGDFAYPVFQFERHNGLVRVKTGLRAFMMTLSDRDPWSVAIIAKTPAPELNEATPLDWARDGGDEQQLLDYAHRLNAEFNR